MSYIIEVLSIHFLDFLQYFPNLKKRLDEISIRCGGKGFLHTLLYGPDVDIILFVYFIESNPVGFAVALPFKNVTEIYEVCVDPNYRRQGIASRMIEKIKETCPGPLWLGIIIDSENEKDLIRLYTRQGFSLVGKSKVTPNGSRLDVSIWNLALN